MVKVESGDVKKQLITWVQIHLFILLLVSTQRVLSGNVVKYLPGYDGELPFKLETGYISVDGSELFYYFIESEGNPENNPLFLWLSGGPGCTSFAGLINENGPLEYDTENYTGGFPKLRYYPYARTKWALASPTQEPQGSWASSDTKSSEQTYQFLRKWLVEKPQFLSVDLFIGGDSYSGFIVPLVTKKIIKGNNEKQEPSMNIKGYLAGAPMTDRSIDDNSYVEFAHRTSLISDVIYENAKLSCKGNYVKVDSRNTECIAAIGAVEKCVKPLFYKDILKPNCELLSPNHEIKTYHRSLEEGMPLVVMSPISKSWCTTYGLTNGFKWGNYESVREALHVRKGTMGEVSRCNFTVMRNNHYDLDSVVHVHKELSQTNLKVLVERLVSTS